MLTTTAQGSEAAGPLAPPVEGTSTARSLRITSVDALRGFVMFMMIFVNDLAGAGKIVPNWMVHFSDRHRGGSGMTFVDLVFPAFLFLVGMSVPLALGGRVGRSEPIWKILGHVLLRTLSLLFIGILMVHETPATDALGWSGDLWCVLMYLSAIAAFASLFRHPSAGPPTPGLKVSNLVLRVVGLAMLVWLTFAFRNAKGQPIVSLKPFAVDTSWYGILGLIGWAYLVACLVFLTFRNHRTAILGCMALLMCLFAAEKNGLFAGFWLRRIVGIGATLGSQGAIATGGLLLGSILTAPDVATLPKRSRFTFWFVVGCAAAAVLLNGTYGISKNQATPSWCFWACAITAALWYGFYLIADVHPVRAISRPLAIAGQNVLLAYLISEMLPGLLTVLGLDAIYGQLGSTLPGAIARSAFCGVAILVLSATLNRIGFRLRL